MKENDIISKVLLTINHYKGSISAFRLAITNDEYSSAHSKNFTRLLLWKACLITETLKIQQWKSKLHDSRVVYHKLSQHEDMIVPWWKLDDDSIYYQPQELGRRPSKRKSVKKHSLQRVNNVDDPLTSDQDPETNDTDLELLQTILMDIDRIFPGEDFFHAKTTSSLNVKRDLIRILYVWSKCNPQVGYKQGIHEILGLIYLNLYRESITIPNTNTFSNDDFDILSIYDLRYLPHDLFTIFNKLMITSGVAAKFYENEQTLWKSIEEFNVGLMKVDQLIHYNLVTKLKLESQLWIIRYLRLLLLRELGNDLETTSLLWDKLIAVEFKKNASTTLLDNLKLTDLVPDSTNNLKLIPELISYIIIILLINIKTELITCDFSESLSLLLHYPINERLLSSPNFVFDIFKYAVKLYERRNDDLKLYEFGLKLNHKLNPNLKISMSFSGSTASHRNSADSILSSRSGSLSPISSINHLRPSLDQQLQQKPLGYDDKTGSQKSKPNPTSADLRAEKMAFEKYRLEMRLKKKAQQMIKP